MPIESTLTRLVPFALASGAALALSLSSGCASSNTADSAKASAAAEVSGRLGLGDRAPAVTVRTPSGDAVPLSNEWRNDGPIVLTFYRGGWCPYCNRALAQWEEHADELRTLGYRLVAITPEAPSNAAETESKNDLDFTILSDAQHAASDAFGISFDLTPETVERYKGYGIDLSTHNADGQWRLPHRGTYVIDRSGTIKAAWVVEDYTTWTQPEEVLAAIRAMQ